MSMKGSSMSLLDKIKQRKARVVVIGAGYVGLPLSVGEARIGFSVTGFDTSEDRVRAVGAGKSYIRDVNDAELAELVAGGQLAAANDPEVLARGDALIICVPTPLNKTKDPDISYIMQAAA